jgi:hypothetical protein
MKKILLTIILAILMANTVWAEPVQIGNSTIYWEIKNDTLYITGTGDMPDFESPFDQPWFAFHKNIVQLDIADEITAIGDDAFGGCNQLTSLKLPVALTYIGEGAFYGCIELTGALVIPDNVTAIGNEAFSNCNQLTSLTLSAGLISIGKSTFYNCRELTGTLVIPDKVNAIGIGVFWGCSKLTSLVLPDSLTSIEDHTFRDCSELSGALVIPNKITTIGAYAFYNCSKLDSLVIGSAVEIIGDYAFRDCRELSGALVIPDKVVSIGSYAFRNCSEITSLTLPDSLVSIGSSAFDNCRELTGNLVIPDKVTFIPPYAFGGTGITSLTLFSSVTGIGTKSFSSCSRLTQITSKAIVPYTISPDAFSAVPRNIPLYVPCQSQLAYAKVAVWKDFKITTVGGTGINFVHSADVAMGTVEIIEMDCETSSASFRAIPEAGYRFVKWNDGNTDNPRTAEISAESSFTAEFAVILNVESVLAQRVSVYPNPVTDKLHINSSLPVQSITIIDALGRTITQQNNVTEVVNVSKLPKGVYLVKVRTEEGEVSKRVVKE